MIKKKIINTETRRQIGSVLFGNTSDGGVVPGKYSGQRGFIVVGTNFNYGEDITSRGHIKVQTDILIGTVPLFLWRSCEVPALL